MSDDTPVSCHQCGYEYSKKDLQQSRISGECPSCGHRYSKPR